MELSDNNAVDISTIQTGDVTVAGLGTPTLSSIDTNVNAASCSAMFTLAAPSGGWTASQNGAYTITLNSGSVADEGGLTVS